MALTATDINPGMLDYAQGKLKDLKGIDWQEADIANRRFRTHRLLGQHVSSDSCLCQITIARFVKCAAF